MVLGIVGMVLLCIPFIGPWFGLPLGLLAVALGGVAMSKSGNDPARGGRGMAVTGLVIGIITLAVALIRILIWTPFYFT